MSLEVAEINYTGVGVASKVTITLHFLKLDGGAWISTLERVSNLLFISPPPVLRSETKVFILSYISSHFLVF